MKSQLEAQEAAATTTTHGNVIVNVCSETITSPLQSASAQGSYFRGVPTLKISKALGHDDFNQATNESTKNLHSYSLSSGQEQRPSTSSSHRGVCLSKHYGLARVNNYNLRERKIMRAQFTMTPKQVSNL